MKASNIVLIKYTEEKTKGNTRELTIQRHRQHWPQTTKRRKQNTQKQKQKHIKQNTQTHNLENERDVNTGLNTFT